MGRERHPMDDYEEHDHENCCSWDEERIKKLEEKIEKIINILISYFGGSIVVDKIYTVNQLKELRDEGD